MKYTKKSNRFFVYCNWNIIWKDSPFLNSLKTTSSILLTLLLLQRKLYLIWIKVDNDQTVMHDLKVNCLKSCVKINQLKQSLNIWKIIIYNMGKLKQYSIELISVCHWFECLKGHMLQVSVTLTCRYFFLRTVRDVLQRIFY